MNNSQSVNLRKKHLDPREPRDQSKNPHQGRWPMVRWKSEKPEGEKQRAKRKQIATINYT